MDLLFSAGQVARLLGLPAHRIAYAHASLALAEPGRRILNKRMYTIDEVRAVAAHFGVPLTPETDAVISGKAGL